MGLGLYADFLQIQDLFHTDDNAHGPIPLVLSKAILHTIAGAGVMPGKGILATSDITGAALETTLIVHDDLTALVELVEVGRTNVQTVTDCAAALAYLLIDEDVGLLAIDLEDVQP
jgi:hypothetical protein